MVKTLKFFFHEKIVLVDNTERQLHHRPAFEDLIIRSWNEFPAIKKLFSLSLFTRLGVLFILRLFYFWNCDWTAHARNLAPFLEPILSSLRADFLFGNLRNWLVWFFHNTWQYLFWLAPEELSLLPAAFNNDNQGSYLRYNFWLNKTRIGTWWALFCENTIVKTLKTSVENQANCLHTNIEADLEDFEREGPHWPLKIKYNIVLLGYNCGNI